MKYSKKALVYDKVIVVFNADKDKYLIYKTSTSGDTIGNTYACIVMTVGD